VGSQRQASFFERALDHYFQRALRPRVLLRSPAPRHLDEGFRRFGFRRVRERVRLMSSSQSSGLSVGSSPVDVVAPPPEEVGRVLPFWASASEQAEISMALDVLAFHPNPSEQFVPLVASRDGRDVASAIAYSDGRVAGFHEAASDASELGRETTAELLLHAARLLLPPKPPTLGVWVRDAALVDRLQRIGFEPVGERIEYELPLDVELDFPRPGPPTPPRWRPPRTAPD
ncbi:MAG: hypothetical protein ACREEC_06140, partial [Thermoplasmata archaeon]